MALFTFQTGSKRVLEGGETLELYRSAPRFVVDTARDYTDMTLNAVQLIKGKVTNNAAAERTIEKLLKTVNGGMARSEREMMEFQAGMRPGDEFFFYELKRGDYVEHGYLILDRNRRIVKRSLADSYSELPRDLGRER